MENNKRKATEAFLDGGYQLSQELNEKRQRHGQTYLIAWYLHTYDGLNWMPAVRKAQSFTEAQRQAILEKRKNKGMAVQVSTAFLNSMVLPN